MINFFRRVFSPNEVLVAEPKPAKPKVSPVVTEICRCFAEEVIEHQSLDRHGISEICVRTPYGYATISWFSRNDLYRFILAGEKFPYEKGDLYIILRAAQKRAEGLFEEKIKLLESVPITKTINHL